MRSWLGLNTSRVMPSSIIGKGPCHPKACFVDGIMQLRSLDLVQIEPKVRLLVSQLGTT